LKQEEEKEENKIPENKPKRLEYDQKLVLPGIHRYQFFSNLRDRALTKDLNRAAMFGIAVTLGADILKPIVNGVPETVYCYECRACYATQDRCPVGNAYQAELVVASRVNDYPRFLRNGGMKCIRCGACQGFCVQYLELPKIFGTMQLTTMSAIKKDLVPLDTLKNAFRDGLISHEFIDEITGYLESKKA
jgi:ferredoxin